MTPTEKGVFCLNCNKEVFDFTKMSDYQLAKFLDNDQKICGRFKPEQLNKNISSLENNNYSKVGLLLSAFAFLSVSTPIFSQKKTPKIIITKQLNDTKKESAANKKTSDSIQIKGQIVDDKGPIPGTNVLLKGYLQGAKADFDGNFSINIDEKEINKNLILVFSYIGLETQEIKINKETMFLKVRMIEDDTELGGVVIVKKQNIFRRIGNLFRKKENKTCR